MGEERHRRLGQKRLACHQKRRRLGAGRKGLAGARRDEEFNVDDAPSGGGRRAGIRPGDVILEWNAKKVDHRSLPSTISNATVDKKVNVLVWRSGAAITLGVTPAKAPN